MVKKETIVELLPHYAAMLLLVFLVIGVLREVVGDVGFWVELLFILVIVFAYPPLTRRLGVAPDIWDR